MTGTLSSQINLLLRAVPPPPPRVRPCTGTISLHQKSRGMTTLNPPAPRAKVGTELILATKPFAKDDAAKSWLYLLSTAALLLVAACTSRNVAGRSDASAAQPPVPRALWVDATDALLAPTAEWTNKVELADLNGDGLLDILFANGGDYSTPGTPELNRVFYNQGPGRPFVERTTDRLHSAPEQPVMHDQQICTHGNRAIDRPLRTVHRHRNAANFRAVFELDPVDGWRIIGGLARSQDLIEAVRDHA